MKYRHRQKLIHTEEVREQFFGESGGGKQGPLGTGRALLLGTGYVGVTCVCQAGETSSKRALFWVYSIRY